MIRTVRTMFAWKTVRDTGCFLYQENAVTGERRVRPGESFNGNQPHDEQWVKTGIWTKSSYGLTL